MTFEVQTKLTPSEVYYAAIGIFLSEGYETHPLDDGIFPHEIMPELHEIGRVFRKNGEAHVLYFPGKDQNEGSVRDATNVTYPLSNIISEVNKQVALKKVANIVKRHYVVCESRYRRRHFVYASDTPHVAANFVLQDSKAKHPFYSEDPIIDIIRPGPKKTGAFKIKHFNLQKDKVSCGPYVLHFLLRDIQGERPAVRERLPATFNQAEIEKLELFYKQGVAHCASLNKDVPSLDEDEENGFSMIGNGQGLAKPVLSQHKVPPLPLSFWQRHRIAKYALIGLGIGLGVAAAGFVLAFAWPVLLPAVGGLIAAHIAVGAMATTTVGLLGLGALGLIATAMATSASLLTKWIKDKVSGAKPAAVSPKAQFESSYAKIERRHSMSLDTASSLTTTSSSLTRSKSSSDLSLVGSLKPQENISLPEGVLAALSRFSPSVSQKKGERDEISNISNGRKKTEPETVSRLYPSLTE